MTDALAALAEVRPVDKESVLARIRALATKPGASVEPGEVLAAALATAVSLGGLEVFRSCIVEEVLLDATLATALVPRALDFFMAERGRGREKGGGGQHRRLPPQPPLHLRQVRQIQAPEVAAQGLRGAAPPTDLHLHLK